jgi:hypothetical protein
MKITSYTDYSKNYQNSYIFLNKFSTKNITFCGGQDLIKPIQKLISNPINKNGEYKITSFSLKNFHKTNFEEKRLKLIHKFGLNENDYKSKPCELYSYLLDNIYYNQIRQAQIPYKLRPGCNPNINSITSNETNEIKVINKSGWNFRVSQNRKTTPVIDRISLNVYPETELIQKLDKFIAKSNGLIEYKVPVRIEEWNERHDPITIFFRKAIDKTDKNAIFEIASPYIRPTNKEVLLGIKIADGIYQVLEPTEKEILALIKRAKKLKLDPKLIECLKNPNPQLGAQLFTYNNNGELIVKTSPAIVESVKRLIDDLLII